MAFPSTPEFEDFIASLSLHPPASKVGWANVTLAKEQAVVTETGNVASSPALELWYRTDSGLTPAAFNRRLAKELKAQSHPDSDSTVNCLAGIVAAAEEKEGDRLSLLKEILNAIVECDVSHYAFLAPSVESVALTWNDFTFGRIDFDKFVYRCKKAGWERELQALSAQLRECSGIESPVYQTRTIAWPSLKHVTSSENADVLIQLIDRYFKACSEVDMEYMWQQLDESQHLFSTFDCNWVDVRMLRRSPIAKCCSIYFSRSGTPRFGNVTFRTAVYTTRFSSQDKVRFDQAQALQHQFALTGFSQSEIHQTIRSCLRFTHRAKQQEREGQISEAFLHLVIALEILFSEAKATTEAVSSRVAVMGHRKLGKAYGQMCKTMARLYDLRSKYVHRGVLVTEENFNELQTIILCVLQCLLRVQAQPESHAEGFVSTWLKGLDWIGASLDANRPVDPKTLSEHGIE